MTGSTAVGVKPEVPAKEFLERRQGAAEAAAERGLDGLVVWSRGGTTVDHYADVYYLTHHQTPIPCFTDSHLWTASGHAAVVLPVDGEPVLVTDSLDDEDGLNRIDEVRFALHIPQTVAEVIKESGLDGRRIGLVGVDNLLHSSYEILAGACDPATQFESADDLLRRMRVVKSPAELEMARHASAVGVEWITTTLEGVAAGRTEAEIVGDGIAHLISRGGYPYDSAFASGPAAHRIWGSVAMPHWNSERRLQEGDLIHCDQWGQVNGYLTDFSRSTVVGGEPTEAQREVLEAPLQMVETMIAQVRPGISFGELYEVGGKWMVDNGFAEFEADHEESGNISASCAQ